mmetsp:Transcript_5342/g.15580  ORF Transcript_5342/g.15580 Transcript_5342/m.15580 type:complete len:676 (-) Transcript_5342:327-2354(-)
MTRSSILTAVVTVAAATICTAYIPSRPAVTVTADAAQSQNSDTPGPVAPSSRLLSSSLGGLRYRTLTELGRAVSSLSMSLAPPPDEAFQVGGVEIPVADENGIYEIKNKEQHQAFLKANPDKVVVLKFYAPWCRACKGLEPKFIRIRSDEKYERLPMLWAQMSIQHNKDYIKSIGVLALPSVHIYAGSEGLVENFPCGPSKVPIFKKKLASTLNLKIDPQTLQLKSLATVDGEIDCSLPEMQAAEPCADRSIVSIGDRTELSVGSAVVSEDMYYYLRNEIPYFKDFNDDEFKLLMNNAKLQTFEAGSVILRQGIEGRTFFVIDSGEVELSINVAMASDPLMTPPGYLGAVINRLGEREFFGERSLITGNPLAASLRATEKTRCYAFDKDDIPATSVLSGKVSPSDERLAQIDDKYGLELVDLDYKAIDGQTRSANAANQARGSVNTPEVLIGVDTDDEIEIPLDVGTQEQVVEMDIMPGVHVNGNDDMVISLLLRFQLIRSAARCFEYIVHTQTQWGGKGEQRRRSMLVSRLTAAQREEFTSVFRLIDTDNSNTITMLELKRAMMSIGEEKTDEELYDMINKADPLIDGNTAMSYKDFMGVMAEAEFYYLFMETFKVMDKQNIGFVKASDLDKALCGVRDLISDDRKSIIDVDDGNMLIDYEQFARMLLGSEVRH